GAPDPLPGATTTMTRALRAALAVDPRERTASMPALAEALGGRVSVGRGRDMTVTIDVDTAHRPLLESVVRAVAGVFDAAAASLALIRPGGSLLYYAAWGAGAAEIVGRELDPGQGIAGRAIRLRRAQLVASVTDDPDWARAFAAGTGYTPN